MYELRWNGDGRGGCGESLSHFRSLRAYSDEPNSDQIWGEGRTDGG